MIRFTCKGLQSFRLLLHYRRSLLFSAAVLFRKKLVVWYFVGFCGSRYLGCANRGRK